MVNILRFSHFLVFFLLNWKITGCIATAGKRCEKVINFFIFLFSVVLKKQNYLWYPITSILWRKGSINCIWKLCYWNDTQRHIKKQLIGWISKISSYIASVSERKRRYNLQLKRMLLTRKRPAAIQKNG